MKKYSLPLFLTNIKKEGKTGENKISIIRALLEKDKVPISQISELSRLSTPTVLNLLTELKRSGIIESKGIGVNKGGGRRPELYGLVKRLLYIVCIDIDLYVTRILIFDNTLMSIGKIHHIPYTLSKNRDDFRKLLDKAKEIIVENMIAYEKIGGYSICLPGLTNSNTGESFSYLTENNEQTSLKDYIESYIKKPLVILNDVKAATLGELRMGKAKNKGNALILLMDWGVGLGIVMDGKLREGSSGYSGEIGHVPFEDNGSLCYCGKRGCLETIASGRMMTKMAIEKLKSGENSILEELSGSKSENIDPITIVSAANKGDLFSIKLLSDLGASMGKIIAMLIQIFNPEIVILEGKIAKAGEYITIPMLQAINTYCMRQIRDKTEIVSSELGEYANLIGCASKGLSTFFK